MGVGGITLGGGIGYLVRKSGLTVDDLLAAEIVTAGGEVLQVDAITTRTSSGRSAVGGQLRRGDPLPVPAARVAAIVGGMLILPASPR